MIKIKNCVLRYRVVIVALLFVFWQSKPTSMYDAIVEQFASDISVGKTDIQKLSISLLYAYYQLIHSTQNVKWEDLHEEISEELFNRAKNKKIASKKICHTIVVTKNNNQYFVLLGYETRKTWDSFIDDCNKPYDAHDFMNNTLKNVNSNFSLKITKHEEEIIIENGIAYIHKFTLLLVNFIDEDSLKAYAEKTAFIWVSLDAIMKGQNNVGLTPIDDFIVYLARTYWPIIRKDIGEYVSSMSK